MSNQIKVLMIKKQYHLAKTKQNKNPLFSPSTSCKTSIQLQNGLIQHKINHSKSKQLLIQPLPSPQPIINDESIAYQPNESLSQIKTNLTQKFATMANSPNKQIDDIIKDKNQEVNNSQYDFISSSNSQSSLSHEEKSLIENLTPIESTVTKKNKTFQNKIVSFQGVIELENDHKNQITSFKAYKDDDIWSVPINYNFLLQEREDEGISSDEDRLTQSTQSVLTELIEGISIIKKDNNKLFHQLLNKRK